MKSRYRLIQKISFFLMAFSALSCAHEPKRYRLADPLWEDQDRNHVPQKPAEYYSGMYADVVDKTLFRPLAKAFRFPLESMAKNANAIDEVPNSSWFINRIGYYPMSIDEIKKGSCRGPKLDGTKGPWIVIGAKPNGANPGFFIKAPTGVYLLKFDGPMQPQRATAADVIGSKFYHAAGYFAPCNQIVYFRPDIFKIGKKAKAKNKYGEKYPVTQKEIDAVLKMAFRLKNGLMRAAASKFLPGRPLGPWKYNGIRDDDPNDIILHQDRRELRGARLLAAWLGHTDAREQNTLDLWVKRKNRSFIRHYYLDFGDCFGSRWDWDGLSRRLGHSYYLDIAHVLEDMFSLGLISRPWNKVSINPEYEIFGYFSDKYFDPIKWQVAYPNPAFSRMDFRDGLWMARIISRFSDQQIRATVEEGELTDKDAENYLVNVLIKRRDAILKAYFLKHAPLDHFRLVKRTKNSNAQSLCFEDLALKHHLIEAKKVFYKLRFYGGKNLDQELGWLQFKPDPDHPHRSCIQAPMGDKRPSDFVNKSAADNDPLRYGVLKIFIHQKPMFPPTSSLWLHFYDLGKTRGYKLVGIERRPQPVMPDLY